MKAGEDGLIGREKYYINRRNIRELQQSKIQYYAKQLGRKRLI